MKFGSSNQTSHHPEIQSKFFHWIFWFIVGVCVNIVFDIYFGTQKMAGGRKKMKCKNTNTKIGCIDWILTSNNYIAIIEISCMRKCDQYIFSQSDDLFEMFSVA